MSALIHTEKEAFWYLPQHLSDAQKQALTEFRQQLDKQQLLLPSHSDDPTLLRFLKARQWHVEPALTMYTNMVNWRKEQQIDQMYQEFELKEFDAMVKHYPHFYHKQDKHGRPVYIEKLGQTDAHQLVQICGTMERVMQYHTWTWERFVRVLVPACSTLCGKPIVTATIILDLEGLSLKNFTRAAQRLLHTIAKVDQDYYPEHLGQMFIINTPFIFKSIWACVNPLLEERTRKKIQVLGYDYQNTLKQMIPEENLLEMFGGKSTCEDFVASQGAWTSVEPCKSQPWLPKGSAAHSSWAAKHKAVDPGPVDSSPPSTEVLITAA